MARGSGRRGSGPDVVLVTTRKYRTFDDGDLDVFNVGHQANRIRNYAVDDHESMCTKSRRQDQALMRDITSRLSQLNQQPASVRYTRSRPQVFTSVSSGSRRSSVVYPSHSTPPRHVRASSVPPLHHASTTSTVHHTSPTFTLLTPSAKRGYYYGIDDWFYPQYHIPRRTFYRAGSEPPRGGYSDSSTNMAVQNARRSLFKLERELGTYRDWDIDDEPAIRRTSVRSSSSRHVRASSVEPPQTRQKVATYGARSAPFRGRSSSYVTPVRSSRVRQLEEEWASEPEPPRVVPQSLSSLRVRTAEARSKMDRNKVLLDRYLPLPGGAPPEVEYEIANKFGELAARSDKRIPSLMARRYSTGCLPGGRSPPVAPYRSAYVPDKKSSGDSDSSYSRRPSARPPLSAARRNAREVLCKTKKDPHYYD